MIQREGTCKKYNYIILHKENNTISAQYLNEK